MSDALSNTKKKDTAYYIKSIIGIAIMIFFGLIPAPEPITQTGMILLGQFIGLVFLWTFVDMVWPTFAAIICFGFIATDVYPNSFALASVYEAGEQSIGNWVTVIVIGLLIFCEVLNETGLIRRIAIAFITTKFARKGPWAFTFMFFLAAFIIGLFMDCTAVQILMFALATEIFQLLGVGTEDKWAKVMSIGVTFICVVTCAATPICHTMPILFLGIYSGIAGTAINWLGYTAVCVPIAIILCLIMYLFFRFIVKPDMSKVENVNIDEIKKLQKAEMSKSEKFVAVVTVILIIVWILPGVLSIAAPDAAITTLLNDMTLLTPLLAVIVLFAIVRFDGKPVLDIPETMKNINWMVVMLLAGIMMIASAFGEDTTGISAWVTNFVSPIVSNVSPFMLIVLMCVIAVILTNIANNIPVGIVLTIVGTPIAMQLGINPFLVATAVSFCSIMGFTIPPAFVPVGTCYAYPYGGPKYTLRWGLLMMCATIVVTALLMYPLGSLFC